MPTARPGSVKPVLVLGLGNVLLTDDGFGPTLLERLRRRSAAGAKVEFVDGGTMGLGLLSLLAERRCLLILDAFRAGRPAGTLMVERNFEWQQAGKVLGRSAHDGNAAGLLAVATLTGDLPPRLALVGVEPQTLDTGVGLSDTVEAQLPEAEREAWRLIEELVELSVCV